MCSLLWLDTTAIVTSMRNFPNERGSIAGDLQLLMHHNRDPLIPLQFLDHHMHACD